MSNNTDSNEWKTVTRGRYVPPNRRAEVEKLAKEEEKKKPLDFNNDMSFPTLGVKTKTAAWGAKKTFTETIHGLIALEQRTAEEREVAEEEAKKNEGNAILRYPKNIDEWLALAERFNQRAKEETEYLEAAELGCQVGKCTDETDFWPSSACDEDDVKFAMSYHEPEEDQNVIYGRPASTPYTTNIPAPKSQKTQKSISNLLERKRESLLRKREAAAAAAAAC